MTKYWKHNLVIWSHCLHLNNILKKCCNFRVHWRRHYHCHPHPDFDEKTTDPIEKWNRLSTKAKLILVKRALDWPKSQTCMEWCHACAALFWGVWLKNKPYHLGPYSLHLLLLKSSMVQLIIMNTVQIIITRYLLNE